MLLELIQKIKDYNPQANLILIEKAFLFANKAHKGQKRRSGEDYITHPYQVALILTELKADSASICAGLLHDVLEDCDVKLKDLEREFGKEIAELVEGVTKLNKVHFEDKEDYNAENVRKVLLATTKDIRVILIKLADRLHNLRTIQYLPKDKRDRMARESSTIYAHVAQKLGLYWIKGELEDLSLRYLEPDIYEFLSKKINEKRGQREKRTEGFIKTIKSGLKKDGINAVIIGRAKYFSSIYRTMKKRNKDFSEIYDLIAVRVITDNVEDCYSVLGIVHQMWKPIPRKFKDYIAVPKSNGYQSLHTSVITNEGKVLEIQIRTKEMDIIAEEGIAAHWRYKGTERDKKFEQKINWIKKLLHWKMDGKDFVENLKFDFFEKEVIVFTPKGEPIVLPENSTPIDFAYAVHTDVGNKCSKVEVNGKIVPFDYILKSGEIVNIITKNKALPNRQWLKFVKTSKARSKIRVKLGIESDYSGVQENLEEPVIDKIIVSVKKPIKMGGCCSPKYNEEIIGFLTKDGKVTVHTRGCVNAKLNLKKVDVDWKRIEDEIQIKIYVMDRVGILSDILEIISKVNVNIKKISTKTTKNRTILSLTFDKKDQDKVSQIVNNLKLVKDITEVKYG